MRIDLDIAHVNRLFELTELHMEWFKTYYPNSKPKFSTLLEMNHKRILHFVLIEKLGKYTHQELDQKFDKMFKVYNSLFEIAEYNRRDSVIINDIIL